MSDSLQPHGYSPPGSSVHGDSPGKNTGVGCHALLQEIFPIQGLNPGLPDCRRILYHLRYHSIFIDWRYSVNLRWNGVLLFKTYPISITLSSPECSKIVLNVILHSFFLSTFPFYGTLITLIDFSPFPTSLLFPRHAPKTHQVSSVWCLLLLFPCCY